MQLVIGMIDRRQMELRLACRPLGARLDAEKPGRVAERLLAYYDAAQRSIVIDEKFTHASASVAD